MLRMKHFKLNKHRTLCQVCCMLVVAFFFLVILYAFQLDSYYKDAFSWKSQVKILQMNRAEIFLLKTIRLLKGEDSYNYLFHPKCGEWGEMTKSMAAFNLGEIKNKEAAPPLINALNSHSDLIVMDAIEALGKIGGAEAIHALIYLLDTSHDNGIKHYAISALGELHAKEALPSLRNIFENKSECFTIKNATYLALQKILGTKDLSCFLKKDDVLKFEKILQQICDPRLPLSKKESAMRNVNQ